MNLSTQTSNSAFFDLRDSGKLSERQREVMLKIHSQPGRDWTNNELAQALGWPINRITGRISELRGKWLECGPKRFCTVEPSQHKVTTVLLPRTQAELFANDAIFNAVGEPVCRNAPRDQVRQTPKTL